VISVYPHHLPPTLYLQRYNYISIKTEFQFSHPFT